MKKFLSILLSFSIIFTSVSTVSALDIELPKNLDNFTEDVADLINEYEDLSSSESAVFFTAADESETENSESTNRLIVKSTEKIDTLNAINSVSGYNDLYILQFENSEDCEAALEYYSTLSCVKYVQEDGIVTETAIEETEATVNEAAIDISSQYQSDVFGYTNAKANMGSAAVTIAVVDSGVANDHEYLQGRVIPTGFDSVDNESCYDLRGHGTHVAGIIAANTKSNVKIKPYKVLGADGKGTEAQLYLGIQAAIEDGVDIINLSLSKQGESEVIHEAVQNAYNAGITVVAAAGNDNVDISQVFYSPACYEEVICVVSIDVNKRRASTSNWRPKDTLSAPGVNILSSHLNNTYKIMSGTSMATPFISCCVAYLLATGNSYSPKTVYDTLYANTKQGPAATIHYVVPGQLVTVENTCATPVFTYQSGEFSGYLNVKITCDTPGATIMYRTSDMKADTYYEYTGPVRIEESTSFTAYAFCKGYKNSDSASIAYTKADIDASVFEVDENGVLIGYNGSDTDIKIPDFINGISITGFSASAFSDNTAITSISFGKGITAINEGAFKNCTALLSVYAPNCTNIGAEAFSGCIAFTTLSTPSVVNIGDKAFSNCTVLTKLTLSKLLTLGERTFENSGITTFSAAKLTTIGDYAFSGLLLKTINLPAVTTIGSNAFEDCKNLTSASFQKATNMGSNCFNGCDALNTVSFGSMPIVPQNIFKNCTTLNSVSFAAATEVENYAFYGCSSLTDINLPKITSVGNYAFYGCGGITSFDFTDITSIGDYSFSGTGLDAISIPGLTVLGEKVFYDCLLVKSIEMPVATTFDTISFLGLPNVETLDVPYVTEFLFNGGSFAEVFPKLKTFNNPNGIKELPSSFFEGCSSLESVTFINVKKIDDKAFADTALREAKFPSATTVGKDCFTNMPTLESIELNALNYIDFSIFSGSENIKTINVANLLELPEGFRASEIFPNIRIFNSSCITNIPDYAFKGCSELIYYNFIGTVTIGEEAFSGTAINNPDCQRVTSIGAGAFKDCTNLGDVKLPKLEYIDLSIFENSEYSVTALDLRNVLKVTEDSVDFNFSQFSNLKSVNLYMQPVIPARAFKGCSALTDVNIAGCTKICEEAFAYCASLVDVKINMTRTVEKDAFRYCTNLQTFEANNVTEFDFSTFDGCSNLISLSFNSLLEIPIDEDGKLNINNLNNLESFSADKLTVVPDNFFKNCEKLTKVSFASATEVGDYAFYNTALSEYTLPIVKKIGAYAFYGTDITKVEKATITDIGEYAFAECKALEAFIVPVTTLPVTAISGSDAITTIEIDVTELPVDEDGLTYVSDKPLLVSFTANYVETIPDSYFVNNTTLKEIVTDAVLYVGEKAFMNTAIQNLPSNYIVTIGEYAFYGTQIANINTYSIEEIGDYAFANCPNLISAIIYNENNSDTLLGKSIFENDAKLIRVALYGENIVLPDYIFKNCAKLNKVYATKSWKNTADENLANIKFVGDEAFYGCNSMLFSGIKLENIEHIGKNAFVGVSNVLNPDNFNVALPNLISADEGAFGSMAYGSVTFENAEIIKDIPDCNYIAIGSDIKEFSCDDTNTIICAYENSVVDEFCKNNNINFVNYNSTDTIVSDIDPLLTGYDYVLSFEAIGFNTTYEWYACNNSDRSDAVLIETTLDEPNTIDPIAIFFDNYEENKYTYFYCVATSTENGNVLEIPSSLCKNIFATIKGTENTFIDFLGVIYTSSPNNVNTLDNIFSVDGDIRVTPSYATDTQNCYGTGSIVEILNGDEVAIGLTIVVQGDINGDGVVNVIDLTEIEKAVNGHKDITDTYSVAADANRDETFDITDYQTAVNIALSA